MTRIRKLRNGKLANMRILKNVKEGRQNEKKERKKESDRCKLNKCSLSPWGGGGGVGLVC